MLDSSLIVPPSQGQLPLGQKNPLSQKGLRKCYITGLSSYLPEKILTNRELERDICTSDEWIRSRTGIAQRHLARAGESTSDMAVEAAKASLKAANLLPQDVQLIILATMTGDYPCPTTAGIVAHALGCKNAGCYDLNAACSGFIYALATAKAFVSSCIYSRVLIICSEKMSAFIDYQDRNTCVLFGDGAAACLVTDVAKDWRILNIDLGSDGSGTQHLQIPAGGAKEPANAKSVADKRHFLKMNGKEVFKQAIRRMQGVSESCLSINGLKKEQIDWFIFHQANARIIDALAQRLQIDRSKTICNLQRVGNTSAASIPLALCEIEKRAKGNDLALLSSFGAGFSWAAAILQRVSSSHEYDR